ncbi:hypothetical protein VTH06DRAFT_1448 [Thermothelomyces fergusii]
MMATVLRFTLAAAAFIQFAMSSPVGQASPFNTITASTSPSILPDSCTFRPTATKYQSTGCEFACPTTTSSVWCIADAIVTKPCGCDRVVVSPTTVTQCPTVSAHCRQCSTAWGIFTVTESNCPPSKTEAAAVATTTAYA